MSKTVADHRSKSPLKISISIITCSSSKFNEKMHDKSVDDPSGDIIEELLKKKGHSIVNRRLILDDKKMIQKAVKEVLHDTKIEAIIITGGTGIAPRDVTIESIKEFLDKEIPGFGELFRKMSFDEIGSAAMMTRALAGIANNKPIFCMPGSPNAVEKAMECLIIPEIGHVIKHAKGI
ncbi:MAG: MogA/MoaB family molybdenum cofactor biosynthesis protein [Candidatus Bathyarchaeota archaeon]|nr:MogA/MoaB family molybdenum cofactor biosynthesis protein [Candidatus Bathyarchaeota archaeon]